MMENTSIERRTSRSPSLFSLLNFSPKQATSSLRGLVQPFFSPSALFDLHGENSRAQRSLQASRITLLRQELLDEYELLCRVNNSRAEEEHESAKRCKSIEIEELSSEIAKQLFERINQRKENSDKRRLEELFLSASFQEFLEEAPLLDQERSKNKIARVLRELLTKLLAYSQESRSSFFDIAGLFEQTPTWWTGTQSPTIAVISEALRVRKLYAPMLLATGRALRRSAPLCGELGMTGLSDYGVSLHALSGVSRKDAHVALSYAIKANTVLNKSLDQAIAPDAVGAISRALIELTCQAALDNEGDINEIAKGFDVYNSRLYKRVCDLEEDRWFLKVSHLGSKIDKSRSVAGCISGFASILKRGTHVLYDDDRYFHHALFISQHFISGHCCILICFDKQVQFFVAPNSRVHRYTGREVNPTLEGLTDIDADYITLLTAPDRVWKRNFLSHLRNSKRQFNQVELRCIEERAPIIFGANPESLSGVESRFFSCEFTGYGGSEEEMAWYKDAVIGKDVQWIVCEDAHVKLYCELLLQENWRGFHLKSLSFEEFALLSLLNHTIDFASFTSSSACLFSKQVELLALLISFNASIGQKRQVELKEEEEPTSKHLFIAEKEKLPKQGEGQKREDR